MAEKVGACDGAADGLLKFDLKLGESAYLKLFIALEGSKSTKYLIIICRLGGVHFKCSALRPIRSRYYALYIICYII